LPAEDPGRERDSDVQLAGIQRFTFFSHIECPPRADHRRQKIPEGGEIAYLAGVQRFLTSSALQGPTSSAGRGY